MDTSGQRIKIFLPQKHVYKIQNCGLKTYVRYAQKKHFYVYFFVYFMQILTGFSAWYLSTYLLQLYFYVLVSSKRVQSML